MIKFNFRKPNTKITGASLDVLKRIEYFTKNKKQFIRSEDFMPMDKKEYIEYLLQNLENYD